MIGPGKLLSQRRGIRASGRVRQSEIIIVNFVTNAAVATADKIKVGMRVEYAALAQKYARQWAL